MKPISFFEKCLSFLFLFIAILYGIRFVYLGSTAYIFLIWNLFLAWIPYQVSKHIRADDGWKKGIQMCKLLVWLLFFPNALYIITDLIHLDDETSAPIWFDAILIFSCSIGGLALGFASLLNVEKFIATVFDRKLIINSMMALLLFAGAFGVYLGRFLRWNSWDILSHPRMLLLGISERMLFPIQHPRTWVVTLILTGLFAVLYFPVQEIHKKIRWGS